MKVILELTDYGTLVQISISEGGGFVTIRESRTIIFLTVQALAHIAEAVAEHLEEEDRESI